jgi:ribosomal protein S12 methylthiotransferase
LKKIHVITLGCPKNQVDSEAISAVLKKSGYQMVATPSRADAVIVNTCAFIRAAEQETIATILAAAEHKQKRAMRLVVAGCFVKKYAFSRLRKWLPEVDHWCAPGDLGALLEILPARSSNESLSPRRLEKTCHEERTLSSPGTAYLKIAEGCNKRCSYCVIPKLRGPLRSRSRESLLNEAEHLAGQGARELVLVAQDLTEYGRDRKEKKALVGLLDRLVKIRRVSWIRLMYLYPQGITPDLLARVSRSRKICPYLDIPLQHASKPVLRAMGRGGEAATFLSLVRRVRREVPGIALRTSLIAGFPGEKDSDHQQLLRFVAAARFDRLGVFTYSREAQTEAAHFSGSIPYGTRVRRRKALMMLQSRISRERLQARLGEKLECLIEDRQGKWQIGRTVYDAPDVDGKIFLRGEAQPGTIVRATVTASAEHDLFGEIVA